MLIFNHSGKAVHVFRGDRVAQLICQKIYYPDLQEVQELDDNEGAENASGSVGCN